MRDVSGAPGFRRSPGRRALFGAVVVVGATTFALTGCSGGTNSSINADGTLTLNLGSVLAQTGTLSSLGPPAIAAANLAVADIAAANTKLRVNLIQKDSGDTSTNIASQSVADLLSKNVSAIIGAESSSVSKTIIDQIAKAGVVQISPANTSPEFSTYDSNHFYWRTAPSDVLQGTVHGQKICKDGVTSVAIIYQNDSYGQGLKDNIGKSFADCGGKVAAEVSFDPKSTNLSAEVAQAVESKAEAISVISFDQIKQIVPELAKRRFPFSKLYGVDGNFDVINSDYVNVDIAGAQFTNPGAQPTPEFRARLDARVANDGSPPLKSYTYAPETYDAVMLVALAALRGNGASGETIKNNLQSVSEGGGTKATTFEAAAKLIAAGSDVDYDGLSGPISFASNGDPQQAYISVYRYEPGNTTAFESAEFGDLKR